MTKNKKPTWADVIKVAKDQGLTPLEFCDILMDNHEEVEIPLEKLKELRKELLKDLH